VYLSDFNTDLSQQISSQLRTVSTPNHFPAQGSKHGEYAIPDTSPQHESRATSAWLQTCASVYTWWSSVNARIEETPMQASPYTPGVVTPDVAGRAAQLAFFRERAEYISLLGRFAGRITVYYAARGIGKTSLLRSAQRIFRANKVHTIWITANEDENLLATLLGEIHDALPTSHKARKTAKEAIESVTLSLGTSGTGVKATVKPIAQVAKSKTLKKALLAAVSALQEHGERGLVILIDEIQSADPQSLRAIAHAWQELSEADASPPAGMFAVGLPGSQEYINKAVTFSERFDFIQLPDLNDSAAAAALAEPARAHGVSWAQDALRAAVEHAQGYPYKIQVIGEATWIAAGYPDGGKIITTADVAAGLPEVERQMRSLFAARWRNATRKQQELLAAIAKLGGASVRREDIAKLLLIKTDALSVPRDRLLRAGVIEATDHGLLSFTVPGFTEYVNLIAR